MKITKDTKLEEVLDAYPELKAKHILKEFHEIKKKYPSESELAGLPGGTIALKAKLGDYTIARVSKKLGIDTDEFIDRLKKIL